MPEVITLDLTHFGQARAAYDLYEHAKTDPQLSGWLRKRAAIMAFILKALMSSEGYCISLAVVRQKDEARRQRYSPEDLEYFECAWRDIAILAQTGYINDWVVTLATQFTVAGA